MVDLGLQVLQVLAAFLVFVVGLGLLGGGCCRASRPISDRRCGSAELSLDWPVSISFFSVR